MKTLANKSAVFTTAWTILKNGLYGIQTLSEALKYSWRIERTRKEMAGCILQFKFVKISTGEERQANGTRNMNMIPTDQHPKGDYTEQMSKTENQKAITYYDLDKMAWRSFSRETLIIETIKLVA